MASIIQIKRGTGSAVPSGLADGELAINLDSGQLYFGSGSTSINSFRFTNLIAENYTVSSSVTNIITQTLSGSTKFGDTLDDKHQFTGSLNVLGNTVTFSSDTLELGGDDANSSTIQRKQHGDNSGGALVIRAGDATGTNENGGILRFHGGRGTGTGTPGEIRFSVSSPGSSGTSQQTDPFTRILTLTNTHASVIGNFLTTGNANFTSHLTASGNISSSGTIIAESLNIKGNTILGDNNGGDLIAISGSIQLTGSNGIKIVSDLPGGDPSTPVGIYAGTPGNLGFFGDGSTNINNINAINAARITRDSSGTTGVTFKSSEGSPTSVNIQAASGHDVIVESSLLISGSTPHITASGNIKAGGSSTPTIIDPNGIHFNPDANGNGVNFKVDDANTKVNASNLLEFEIGATKIELGTTANHHVTASGNISESGNIYANRFGDFVEILTIGNTSTIAVDSAGSVGNSGLAFAVDGTTKIGINKDAVATQFFGNTTFDSSMTVTDITASGNISSSGTILADTYKIDDYAGLSNTGTYLELGNANYWDRIIYGRQNSDQHQFEGNITASGDISSSGTIFTDTISSPSNNLIISSSTVRLTATTDGEANLILEADTDNNDENDNPFMSFLQDGGAIEGQIGISGDADKWPDGSALTGTSVNSMVIGMKGSPSSTNRELIFATADTVALKLDNSQNATFTGDATIGDDIHMTGNNSVIFMGNSTYGEVLVANASDAIKINASHNNPSSVDHLVVSSSGGTATANARVAIGGTPDTTNMLTVYGNITGNQITSSGQMHSAGNLTTANHAIVSKTLTVGGAGITPAVTQGTAKITLSTADCNALHTTPIQLVAAQGANTVILPTGGMIRVDRAATQTNSAADLNFHYADKEPGSAFTTAVIHFRRFMHNDTGDRVFQIQAGALTEISQNLTDDVNKALEVSVDSAFTTNCFTSITIFLTYDVFDIS